MKQIAVYLNDVEMADFELVKVFFERRSNCDTIRAMISFCKKNLIKNMSGMHILNEQEVKHDGD